MTWVQNCNWKLLEGISVILTRILRFWHNSYMYHSVYNDFYNPNNIKKDTISPNNAIASQSANPKIAYTNSCFCKWGFRLYDIINPLKTIPIPMPDPKMEIVDNPAPKNLADCKIIERIIGSFIKFSKHSILFGSANAFHTFSNLTTLPTNCLIHGCHSRKLLNYLLEISIKST